MITMDKNTLGDRWDGFITHWRLYLLWYEGLLPFLLSLPFLLFPSWYHSLVFPVKSALYSSLFVSSISLFGFIYMAKSVSMVFHQSKSDWFRLFRDSRHYPSLYRLEQNTLTVLFFGGVFFFWAFLKDRSPLSTTWYFSWLVPSFFGLLLIRVWRLLSYFSITVQILIKDHEVPGTLKKRLREIEEKREKEMREYLEE